MRHRKANSKLNRTSNHRKALFKNLTAAIIEHGHLTTTLTKAKIVKPQLDRLITVAKQGTLHSRRRIQAYFNRKTITSRLVDHLAPNFSTRTSGFTRIIKLDNRRGDNTLMARVEFVDPIIEAQTLAPKSKPTSKSTPNTKAATK